jgi:AcrR family transcriptional regulator
LRAAAELIAEQGWGGVRTRAVAQRAGVNNALVHYYFRTKGALLVEAAVVSFLTDIGPAMARLRSAPGLVAAMDQLLETLRAVDRDSPGVRLMAEVFLASTREPELGQYVAQLREEFRSVIAERIDQAKALQQVDASVDTRAAAVLVVALFDGLLLHVAIDPSLDIESPTGLLAGLFRPPSSRRQRPKGRAR